MKAQPYRYAIIADERVRAGLYRRMAEEGLAPFAMSSGVVPMDEWLRLTEARDGNFLLASVDILGHFHGIAHFHEAEYRMWRFDFTSFRAGFHRAVEQARGAFRWVFEHTDATSIYGVTPVLHRHAVRLAEQCGFTVVSRLPAACWHARRARFVDGIFVLCTQQTLNQGG